MKRLTHIAAAVIAYAHIHAASPVEVITRLTQPAQSVGAGPSGAAGMTQDGQYVLLASAAPNLARARV